jgi:hypothetical protein
MFKDNLLWEMIKQSDKELKQREIRSKYEWRVNTVVK